MSQLQERLSHQLRLLRAERGYSQENVAELLGMSTGGYAKIERGEAEVSLSRLEALANAFKVEVAMLLKLESGAVNFNHSEATITALHNGMHNATLNITLADKNLEGLLNRIVELELKLEKAGLNADADSE